jgi:hypothetical protein
MVSPDSRARIVPAIRQKFHLVPCAKIRDHLWLYRRDDAREDVKKALELNPNQSDGRIGHMMMQTGRARDFCLGSRATFELRPLFVCSTLTLLTESLHRRELAVCAKTGPERVQ